MTWAWAGDRSGPRPGSQPEGETRHVLPETRPAPPQARRLMPWLDLAALALVAGGALLGLAFQALVNPDGAP